jgi:cell division septal protein FtsQ
MNPTLIAVGATVLVFILAFLTDYFSARYVKAVGDKKTHRAAYYSVLMWVAGAIGLVTMIEVGTWVVIPEGAGLYLGSIWGMRD